MSQKKKTFFGAPVVVLIAFLQQEPALGAPETQSVAEICESAASVASRESGVPLDVLRAISLTETGRRRDGALQPWPWTVNMEGVGKWFDTLPEAKRYVDRHFSRGARSFDVGCFQVNYRWHGQAFSSIDDMFDPLTNARYAARFLSELNTEFGDWSKAAGAYHSRTPKYAKKYRARFDRLRANLSEPPPAVFAPAPHDDPSPPRQPVAVRANNFPLLQRQGSIVGIASLVPLDSSRPRLIDTSAVRPFLEQR